MPYRKLDKELLSKILISYVLNIRGFWCLLFVGIAVANISLLQAYGNTPNHFATQADIDKSKAGRSDPLPFYLTKICTKSVYMGSDMLACEAGYVLKVETLDDGTVVESQFMDEYDGYGWSHSRIKKLNDDIYLFNLACGSYCAGNILVGRQGKKQGFDYFFDYDTKTECAVEYDYDKKMWVATPFFSENRIDLVQTVGNIESDVLPKYDLMFNKTGDVEVFDRSSESRISLFTISNPCQQ
ncbi:hypothetical protein [Psychrobacter sp. FDAARGOS_221]|uniref:hypothetical protein n=1 Tax=Psychrobacter sp. FDAARGOS_221 TaxID=1975705 RepID=UPI000BB56BF9|nr:hypothetical protein [Psychrobacter sp. FDAARGOS_221]PNK60247.1 hypothetical protein A6J60_004765 [Psychrobacter sp. FDAARGOS_221]